MGKWELEGYSVDKLNNEIENKNITIPKYQRGTVWNKQKKEKLIDSMNKGFPFGSILLYKNNDKFQMIDGLQRSTTIMEFKKDPSKFFNEENIDEEIVNKIIDCFNIIGNKSEIKIKIKKVIKDWVIFNHNSMKDIQRMQYGDLVDEITNEWPNAKTEKDYIKSLIQEMMSPFQDMCNNIIKMKIPALIYEGDESLLPEIFERINSQGSNLTKQQIYSATWAHDIVKLKSTRFDEIIDNNRDRYENMLDENMELDDYNPLELKKKREVNIFELVFGFGKMISRKYPYLFTFDERDKTKVESIGFNLINACLVQKNNNMQKLNTNLKEYVGLKTEQIELFLTRILESIEYVDKKLGAGTKFKRNTRSDSRVYPLHTEMQITSIIATVFIARHVSFQLDEKDEIINLKINVSNGSSKNEKWKSLKRRFDKNILRIYSMDILGQKWKGSGDGRLNSIITTDDSYYARSISWEDFEQVLNVYFSSLNSERNERKQVAAPKEPEKLMLNLVYSKIFSASDQNDGSNYDIEHLAPKNLMKEKISKYSEGFKLPISSIGNLCLLPEYDNRVKKDKTIYQDDYYLSKIKDIKEIEKKYTFTKEDDLNWLNENLSEEEFEKAYLNFLNNRFKKMKEKVRENLFN